MNAWAMPIILLSGKGAEDRERDVESRFGNGAGLPVCCPSILLAFCFASV